MASPLAFAEFVLDVAARELRRGGKAVPLSPKAFQLLRLLIERRPRALSKRELYDALWPDTVVVEGNLANLIGEVRAALGDDAQRPRFVRTVHRFGYAFREEAVEAGSRKTGPACRLVWKGGRATLGEGEHILGRDPELDLCLDSSSVSRRHARLVVRGGRAVIEDLGSKNGTFVAGRKVERPTVLADGDEIGLGSVRLRFREVRPPDTTHTTTATE